MKDYGSGTGGYKGMTPKPIGSNGPNGDKGGGGYGTGGGYKGIEPKPIGEHGPNKKG